MHYYGENKKSGHNCERKDKQLRTSIRKVWQKSSRACSRWESKTGTIRTHMRGCGSEIMFTRSISVDTERFRIRGDMKWCDWLLRNDRNRLRSKWIRMHKERKSPRLYLDREHSSNLSLTRSKLLKDHHPIIFREKAISYFYKKVDILQSDRQIR